MTVAELRGLLHGLAPADGVTVDDVMRKADTALYRSKAKGHGRFSFYSNSDVDPSL